MLHSKLHEKQSAQIISSKIMFSMPKMTLNIDKSLNFLPKLYPVCYVWIFDRKATSAAPHALW